MKHKVITCIALAIFICLIAVCAMCRSYRPTNDPHINLNEYINLKDVSFNASIHTAGQPTQEGTLLPNSPAVATINKLLQSKEGKWQLSLVTYAPVILLRGPNFTLNFQKQTLIANFTTPNGHPGQLVTNLIPSEYEQLQKTITDSLQPPDK